MADADGKMQIENADNKKSKRKTTRNADGKKHNNKKKTTNKQRKDIPLSSRCHMVGPFTHIHIQNVMPIVDTVLYPGIPFINVTEIRTLRFSSLHAHKLGALLL